MPKACATSARRCSRARCSRRCSTRSATPTSSPCATDGEPVASVLSLYHGGAVLPYWGGGTAAARAPARQRPDVFRADAPRPRARLHAVRFRPLEDRHRRLSLQEELGLRAASRSPMRAGPRPARERARRRSDQRAAMPRGSRCGSSCRSRSPTGSARRSRGGSDDAARSCSSPTASRFRPTAATRSARTMCSRRWPSSRRSMSAASPRPTPTWPPRRAGRARREPIACRRAPSRCRSPGSRRSLRGEPVSLAAFRHPRAARLGRATCSTRHEIDTIYVFSGQMGQYVPADCDGPAWSSTSSTSIRPSSRPMPRASAGPMRWIDAREARLLRARGSAARGARRRTLLVSEAEAALFALAAAGGRAAQRRACSATASTPRSSIPRAVAPHPALAAPGPHFVFTGQMDYPPNVDAALRAIERHHAARSAQRIPTAQFHVVGRAPARRAARARRRQRRAGLGRGARRAAVPRRAPTSCSRR